MFKRALGPFDATMVVIGGIIGSGIFINPYIVARGLDTPALVLGAWAAGGAIALIGAFAYAELGSLLPRAGGQYVYLRDAFHPVVGFLYGWALLFLIETGAIAAVAITFGHYALRTTGIEQQCVQWVAAFLPQWAFQLLGGADVCAKVLGIATILVLSAINYLGVKPGSIVLNIFVVLKVAALAAIVIFAFSGPAATDWTHAARVDTTPSDLLTFGAALIPILFAYGGWQSANYLAEEMRDPKRHLPRSLVVGTVAVVVIYVTVNIGYLRALGLDGLAATVTPAVDAVGRGLGANGERFVGAAIAISTFGFLNLSILAPTRVYYAMAADRAFFGPLAKIHPRFQTPGGAIILQSTWAILLAMTGTYEGLLNTVVFADWIFFGLTVASLFVLRRRLSGPGKYRSPGYPVLPAIFVCIAGVIVFSTIREAPLRSAIGAGLLLLGVPAYYLFKLYYRTTPSAPPPLT